MLNNKIEDLLYIIEAENYTETYTCNNKEDLIKSILDYLDEFGMFSPSEFPIRIDCGDCSICAEDEEEKTFCDWNCTIKRNFVESITEWDGEGCYILSGCTFGEYKVKKVEKCLDDFNFPIPFKLNLLSDYSNTIKEWKNDLGYKNVFLISERNENYNFDSNSLKITNVLYSNLDKDSTLNHLKDNNIYSINKDAELIEVENFDFKQICKYEKRYQHGLWNDIYIK